MNSCINLFQKSIDSIRVGAANSSLIENILVEYYGKKFFLNKISRIIVYNTNTLKINAFDKTINNAIVKSILKANIGLNPYIKDNDIFISLPPVTNEKRKQLIKLIYSEGEKTKINIRLVRRDANIKFNNMYLDKIIDKDSKYRIEKEIQIITNDFINKVDKIISLKESILKKQ